MIIKRPIYNQQLKCVATEILSSSIEIAAEESQNCLISLIQTSNPQLPLFIPFELKSFVDQITRSEQTPVILKLAASTIESSNSLNELKNSPYSIALLIDTPQQLAWLNFADYMGLTEQLMNTSDVSKVVKYCKSKQRKIIAYAMNEPLNFNKCKNMDMDYYCGDFLFKPFIDDRLEIAANKLNILQLIQLLQKEECDLQQISAIIQMDPLLSFQLLRIVNSAAFSGGAPISSIEQAIMRIGVIHLKNWIMLFSMKNISDKPIEVLESGLIRAHMAQEIAKKSTHINSQSAYTAGLLSILDCLLNKSMAELISQITLPKDITGALIHNTGALGRLLSLVTAYESGNWEHVSQQSINGLDLSRLYIESLNIISRSSALNH